MVSHNYRELTVEDHTPGSHDHCMHELTIYLTGVTYTRSSCAGVVAGLPLRGRRIRGEDERGATVGGWRVEGEKDR